jgi:hypothetical protein
MSFPVFVSGDVLNASDMNAVGLWTAVPTSVQGTGVTLSGATTNFSGSTAVSLNGVFNANYRRYRVEINHNMSSSQVLYFRLRNAGADNNTNNYSYMVSYRGYASASNGSFNGLALSTSVVSYADSGTSGFASFDIDAPFLASPTHTTGGTAWAGAAAWTGQQHNLSNSYDGFTVFIAGAGTMSGSINVYGYKG